VEGEGIRTGILSLGCVQYDEKIWTENINDCKDILEYGLCLYEKLK
jgi:hypothetical protein